MAHWEEERGIRRGLPVPAVLSWDFETEAVAETSSYLLLKKSW
jgi:hypothetical protein